MHYNNPYNRDPYYRDPRQQSQRSEGYYGSSNRNMPSDPRPMMGREDGGQYYRGRPEERGSEDYGQQDRSSQYWSSRSDEENRPYSSYPRTGQEDYRSQGHSRDWRQEGDMRDRGSQRFDYRGSGSFNDRDRWQQESSSERQDSDSMRNYHDRGRNPGIGNGGFGMPQGRQDGNLQRSGEEALGGWQSERSYRGAGPRDYNRSDERIREDVCDRLTDHSAIDARDIQVKVEGGEVSLEGSVEGRSMKHSAEDVAAECSGVKDVQNHLKVHRMDAGQQSRRENGRQENEKSHSWSNANASSQEKSSQEKSTRI